MKWSPNPNRPVLAFLVSFALLGVLFMWPWDGVQKAYGRLFASSGNLALNVLGGSSGIAGSSATAKLVADYGGDPEHDIRVGLVNLERGFPEGLGAVRISSRQAGYMPAALLAALVLATPVGWRRKIWALLWGLLAMLLFTALRLGVFLLYAFHGDAPHDVFELSGPWDRLLRLAYTVVTDSPTTTYLLPVIVWVLVTLDRKVIAPARSQQDG